MQKHKPRSFFLLLVLLLSAVNFSIPLVRASPDYEGPNYPGTVVSVDEGSRVPWSNPANAKADDGSYAQAFTEDDELTEYLKATNFGFSIPSGATIDSVKVEIEHWTDATSSNPVKDERVYLVKAGSPTGNNKKKATAWAEESWEIYTYDHTVAEWGVTLTYSDVNSADFGVVISGEDVEWYEWLLRIDFVRITVTYTEAGGPTVTTHGATNMNGTSAKLWGNITAVGDTSCNMRKFEWDVNSGEPYSYSWNESDSFGTGAFNHTITGLSNCQQYFFRAGARTGATFGWGAEFNFTTPDETPPTWKWLNVNSTTQGAAVKISVYWEDAHSDIDFWRFGWNNTGSWLNDSWSDSWIGGHYAIKEDTLNGSADKVQYQFWCNDTSNNVGTTGLQNITLQESYYPYYSEIGHDTTLANDLCKFYVKLEDDVGLSHYRFGCNATGEWVNGTWTSISGTSAWANLTKSLPHQENRRVEYEWWFNDTSEQFNNTGIQHLNTTWETFGYTSSTGVYETFSADRKMACKFNLPDNAYVMKITTYILTTTDASARAVIYNGSANPYLETVSGRVRLPSGVGDWYTFSFDPYYVPLPAGDYHLGIFCNEEFKVKCAIDSGFKVIHNSQTYGSWNFSTPFGSYSNKTDRKASVYATYFGSDGSFVPQSKTALSWDEFINNMEWGWNSRVDLRDDFHSSAGNLTCEYRSDTGASSYLGTDEWTGLLGQSLYMYKATGNSTYLEFAKSTADDVETYLMHPTTNLVTRYNNSTGQRDDDYGSYLTIEYLTPVALLASIDSSYTSLLNDLATACVTYHVSGLDLVYGRIKPDGTVTDNTDRWTQGPTGKLVRGLLWAYYVTENSTYLNTVRDILDKRWSERNTTTNLFPDGFNAVTGAVVDNFQRQYSAGSYLLSNLFYYYLTGNVTVEQRIEDYAESLVTYFWDSTPPSWEYRVYTDGSLKSSTIEAAFAVLDIAMLQVYELTGNTTYRDKAWQSFNTTYFVDEWTTINGLICHGVTDGGAQSPGQSIMPFGFEPIPSVGMYFAHETNESSYLNTLIDRYRDMTYRHSNNHTFGYGYQGGIDVDTFAPDYDYRRVAACSVISNWLQFMIMPSSTVNITWMELDHKNLTMPLLICGSGGKTVWFNRVHFDYAAVKITLDSVTGAGTINFAISQLNITFVKKDDETYTNFSGTILNTVAGAHKYEVTLRGAPSLYFRYPAQSLSWEGAVTKVFTMNRLRGLAISWGGVLSRVFSPIRLPTITVNWASTLSRTWSLTKLPSLNVNWVSITRKTWQLTRPVSLSTSWSSVIYRTWDTVRNPTSAVSWSSVIGRVWATSQSQPLSISWASTLRKERSITRTIAQPLSWASTLVASRMISRSLTVGVGWTSTLSRVWTLTRAPSATVSWSSALARVWTTLRLPSLTFTGTFSGARSLDLTRLFSLSPTFTATLGRTWSLAKVTPLNVGWASVVRRTLTLTQIIPQTVSTAFSTWTKRIVGAQMYERQLTLGLDWTGTLTRVWANTRALTFTASLSSVIRRVWVVSRLHSISVSWSGVASKTWTLTRIVSQGISTAFDALGQIISHFGYPSLSINWASTITRVFSGERLFSLDVSWASTVTKAIGLGGPYQPPTWPPIVPRPAVYFFGYAVNPYWPFALSMFLIPLGVAGVVVEKKSILKNLIGAGLALFGFFIFSCAIAVIPSLTNYGYLMAGISFTILSLGPLNEKEDIYENLAGVAFLVLGVILVLWSSVNLWV